MEANKLRVFLAKREKDNLHYGGKPNPAGTVVRPTDKTMMDSYQRLLNTELMGLNIKQGPVFVNFVYDQIERGREISFIHWIKLGKLPESDDLYDFSKLPSDLIPTDVQRVETAANHFLAAQKNK